MEKQVMKVFADTCETPFYVFDTDRLQKKTAWIRSHLLDEVGLCYSMKANSFILNTMKELVDKIEVCSFGEYKICRAMHLKPAQLIISGVVKKKEELEEILNECQSMATYTAESMQQFEILNEWAGKHKTEIHVLLRIADHTQFGMDKSTVLQICKSMPENNYIKLDGVHFFTGTKKRSIEKNCKELIKLESFLSDIASESGFFLQQIEYGMGMNAAYFEGEEKNWITDEDWQKLTETLKPIIKKHKVTFEMGRGFAAECGYYFTEVVDTKTTEEMHYALIDGGMHQLHYDGQIRGMYTPFVRKFPEETAGEKKTWCICGSLCTTNDVICLKKEFVNLKPKDVLVFENTGAYSCMEGMALFLSHELPAVYTYSTKTGIDKSRESIETFSMNMTCQN